MLLIQKKECVDILDFVKYHPALVVVCQPPSVSACRGGLNTFQGLVCFSDRRYIGRYLCFLLFSYPA